jgi:hypothetical protein
LQFGAALLAWNGSRFLSVEVLTELNPYDQPESVEFGTNKDE